MKPKRHARGVPAPIILRPMATMRLSGKRGGRQQKHKEDEAREKRIIAAIVKRDAERPRARAAAHVAHLGVRERYLRYLRGGNDQRSQPGSPFGSEMV